AVGADGRAAAMGAAGRPGPEHLSAGPDPDQPAHAHACRFGLAVGLHAGRGLRAGLPRAAAVRRAARGLARLGMAVRDALRERGGDGGWRLAGVQAARAGGRLVALAQRTGSSMWLAASGECQIRWVAFL